MDGATLENDEIGLRQFEVLGEGGEIVADHASINLSSNPKEGDPTNFGRLKEKVQLKKVTSKPCLNKLHFERGQIVNLTAPFSHFTADSLVPPGKIQNIFVSAKP